MTLPRSPEENQGQAGDADATSQDVAQQGADSGDAAAAADQAGASTPPPGADDKWNTLNQLLEDSEIATVLSAVGGMANQSAPGGQATKPPEATPQGPAQPSADLADLERRANQGDADAALEYVKRSGEERQRQEEIAQARQNEAQGIANRILESQAVKALPLASQGRLVATYLNQGLVGLTDALVEMGKASTATGGNGQASEEQAKELQRVGDQLRKGTPDVPPGEGTAGPPPLNWDPQQGELKPPIEVIAEFLEQEANQ